MNSIPQNFLQRYISKLSEIDIAEMARLENAQSQLTGALKIIDNQWGKDTNPGPQVRLLKALLVEVNENIKEILEIKTNPIDVRNLMNKIIKEDE